MVQPNQNTNSKGIGKTIKILGNTTLTISFCQELPRLVQQYHINDILTIIPHHLPFYLTWTWGDLIMFIS